MPRPLTPEEHDRWVNKYVRRWQSLTSEEKRATGSVVRPASYAIEAYDEILAERDAEAGLNVRRHLDAAVRLIDRAVAELDEWEVARG